MARAAITWARWHRPDRPVVITTDADNARSVRLAEKLGFTLVDRRRLDGRREPELEFRLAAPHRG